MAYPPGVESMNSSCLTVVVAGLRAADCPSPCGSLGAGREALGFGGASEATALAYHRAYALPDNLKSYD